jgi:hypothetical protein
MRLSDLRLWRRQWWWGETTSVNCGHQQAYCSSLRWYMNIENHGGMILSGEVSWFIHQSSLVILPTESYRVKQEELAKENVNFALRSIFHISKGSLTCCKILWHGTDSFTTPPKECMLWIFIALKKSITLGWLWTHESWVQWKAQ